MLKANRDLTVGDIKLLRMLISLPFVSDFLGLIPVLRRQPDMLGMHLGIVVDLLKVDRVLVVDQLLSSGPFLGLMETVPDNGDVFRAVLELAEAALEARPELAERMDIEGIVGRATREPELRVFVVRVLLASGELATMGMSQYMWWFEESDFEATHVLFQLMGKVIREVPEGGLNALLAAVPHVVEHAGMGDAAAIELLAAIRAVCARASLDTTFWGVLAECHGEETLCACPDAVFLLS
jgi:hypothetical protein